VIIMLVSSANRVGLGVSFNVLDGSLMCKRKNGASIESCGTFCFTFSHLEK
jgi:hypothetical protein